MINTTGTPSIGTSAVSGTPTVPVTPSVPQNTQPSGGLDPSVMVLQKAIAHTESEGNYNAHGQSGEFGAYQFMPQNWKANAQKYLGNGTAPMTPENQDKVAYSVISNYKQQGYSPEEIASLWNSGKPNWIGNVGTNSMGVKFDTPSYVQNVIGEATKLQQQYSKQFGGQANNPLGLPTAEASTGQEGAPKDALTKASDIAGAIFPGSQIGKAIGTGLGYLQTKIGDIMNGTHNADFYDTSTPTGMQLAGDAGQIALTAIGGLAPELAGAARAADAVAPILGEATGLGADALKGASTVGKVAQVLAPTTALGRVAANTALGAGFGATGALANGSPDIGAQTAIGGALGGGAGLVGEVLSHLSETLPRRIINNLLPDLKTEGGLDYAIENTKFGTVNQMVNASGRALDSYGAQIDALLAHPDYEGIAVNGEDLLQKTLASFPNSEYTAEDIFAKLKSQLPSEASIFTKLSKGEDISLQAANDLRQAIDQITYKTKIDSPEVKAGKELAEAFGNSIRNTIKAEVPESRAIFSDYSKEINLNKSLRKLQIRKSKRSFVGFKDMLGALGATGVFGPIGGASVLAGEKIADAPATRVAAARAIQASQPLIKGASAVAKVASLEAARNQ